MSLNRRLAFAVCLFLGLGLNGPALSAEPTSKARIEAEQFIKQAEADWAKAYVTGDASALKRILADDYVGQSSGDGLDNKAKLIAEIEQGPKPPELVSNKLDKIEVRFFTDTLAVALGTEIWTNRAGETGRYVWTDTWAKRGDKWQIIASHNTDLPAK